MLRIPFRKGRDRQGPADLQQGILRIQPRLGFRRIGGGMAIQQLHVLGQRHKAMAEAPASKATTTATIKISVKGRTELTAGEGDGPVDALNNALRKVLHQFYPQLDSVVLQDYRVRILNPETATQATTRVLIESSDGRDRWGTVGVSENIIEASWEALVDSVEYKLFLDEQKRQKRRRK